MARTTRLKDSDAQLFTPASPGPPDSKGSLVPHKPSRSSADVVPARPRAPKAEAGGPDPDLIAILGTYERLADKPNVSPEALGKLLDVQEQWRKRKAQVAFEAAFVRMQPELPVVEKDGRIIVREKDASGKRTGEEIQNTQYAKWETAWPLIRPVLKRHGFSLRHRSSTIIEGGERRVRITAVLSGHGWIDDNCYFDLQADSTGSKNPAQSWGSSRSYAKRYTAFDILGIVARGEDDDAQASGDPLVVGTALTAQELEQIIEFAAAAECAEGKLVAYLSDSRPKGHPFLKRLADLPRSRYDAAIEAIQSYEANKRVREEAAKAKPAGKDHAR